MKKVLATFIFLYSMQVLYSQNVNSYIQLDDLMLQFARKDSSIELSINNKSNDTVSFYALYIAKEASDSVLNLSIGYKSSLGTGLSDIVINKNLIKISPNESFVFDMKILDTNSLVKYALLKVSIDFVKKAIDAKTCSNKNNKRFYSYKFDVILQ